MRQKSNLIRYLKVVFKIGKIRCGLSFIGLVLVATINIVLPKLLSSLIDSGIEKKNKNVLIMSTFLYLTFVFIANSINFFLDNYFENLKLKVSTKYKMDLLEKLSKAKGKYLSNKETGNLLHIMDSDLANIEEFGIDLIFDVIINVLTACIVLSILIYSDIRLLIIILIIQLLLFGANFFITRKISKSIKQVREIIGNQLNFQEQYISNLKLTILSNTSDYFRKLLKYKQDKFVEQSKRTNRLISGQKGIVIFLNEMSMILCYFMGGLIIIQNLMSFGELFAFVKYVSLLIAPCIFLVNFNVRIHQTNISLKKLYHEMDRLENEAEIKEGKMLLDKIDKIQFEEVFFGYGDKNVLDNFHMELRENKVYGIIGESGCGKSTLGNLLYRLWQPDKGKILINGEAIEKYNLEDLREHICIISQDTLLFDGDILENIIMNNRNVSLEKVNEICKKVNLNELLNDIGKKNIGERGNNISGGQRQKIAIARAMLKKCDVFIFDEATSALDNISQNEIMENLKPYLKEKMVIIIAHRTELIKNLEYIYVVKKGRIIEKGNHKKLMSLHGLYYDLLTEKNKEG